MKIVLIYRNVSCIFMKIFLQKKSEAGNNLGASGILKMFNYPGWRFKVGHQKF